MAEKDWNGFKKNGDTYIPNDATARAGLQNKVDKVSGKGLSTNDYSDADKAIVDGVTSALANKVDKVQGKGLSTNDYTNEDKAVVSGIETELVNGEVKTQPVTFTPYEGYVLYGSQAMGICIITATLPYGLCYVAEVEKNTLYKVSKNGGNRFRLAGFVNEPTIPSDVPDPLTYEFIVDDNCEEYIINSGKYSYIALTVNSNEAYQSIEATIEKCELKIASSRRTEQSILGSKNLLNNTATNTTINGIAYVVFEDGSFKGSGTAIGDSVLELTNNNSTKLEVGQKYILSGNFRNAPSSDYYIYISYVEDSETKYISLDENPEVEFVYGEWDSFSINFIVKDGTELANDRFFRPMLRLSTDEDNTYAPYSMTNRQLTKGKADLDSNGKIPSSELPVASTNNLGGIKPDGSTITVDANGVASASGGGGGTTVVPNPSGTPTADLTKVQIENSIYGIPNTTYNVVSKTANGLAPQLPNETATTKYLRQDGNWAVPPNTEYNDATTAVHGLMSAVDKALLGKVFQMRDIISSASYDLNDAKSNGMYFINGVKCQNFPTGLLNSGEDGSTFKHGVVVFRIDVANTYGFTLQLCYRGTTGKLAIRAQYASSGGWEAWKYITFS